MSERLRDWPIRLTIAAAVITVGLAALLLHALYEDWRRPVVHGTTLNAPPGP